MTSRTKRMLSAGRRFGEKNGTPYDSEKPKETYPAYLRRVGQDFLDSGNDATAEDYGEAAALIEELTEVVKLLQEQHSEGRSLYTNRRPVIQVDVDALLKRVTR